MRPVGDEPVQNPQGGVMDVGVKAPNLESSGWAFWEGWPQEMGGWGQDSKTQVKETNQEALFIGQPQRHTLSAETAGFPHPMLGAPDTDEAVF